MYDPRILIEHIGGLARGTTLQSMGVSRVRLSGAVRARSIDRIRPGLFAAPSLPTDVRRAAEHGGALTCGRALRLHGIWVKDDAPPHVWVGRRGRTYPHDGCRCTTHYFHGSVPLGVVDVETALVHLYHCAGDEAFFASLESALHERRLHRAARLRVRSALPSAARWLVDFASGASESGLESLLRLRLRLLGILLSSQVTIAGVGRVDFVLDGRVILEVDGKQNHTGADNRHKDLVRDAAASALGYEVLRFDYAQIMHDWPTVRAAILAALVRARTHG